MKKYFVLFALAILALAPAGGAQEHAEAAGVEGPMTWGAAENVTHYQNLYFTGQPDAAALEAAKRAGVSLVINLRAPDEMNWDEAAAVRNLGMRYENVPLGGKAFDAQAIARIDELVTKAGDEKVLVHCSSSNRAGGWFATHLVSQDKKSLEDALAMGRKAGITKGFVEDAVKAHLATRPPAPSPPSPPTLVPELH